VRICELLGDFIRYLLDILSRACKFLPKKKNPITF
jgi:hypothetical protein